MIGAIHDVVRRRTATTSTNAEGRTVKSTADVSFRGSVDELSARDMEIAAQNAQTHDLAVRAPLDLDVTDRDLIVVTEPTHLAGTYKIDVVRTTRSHFRLLCSRNTLDA